MTICTCGEKANQSGVLMMMNVAAVWPPGALCSPGRYPTLVLMLITLIATSSWCPGTDCIQQELGYLQINMCSAVMDRVVYAASH